MTEQQRNTATIISREDLYDRVWSTPMSRLAKEFGVSDAGLAKICRRHDVPCPPRGYWAKLTAKKAVNKAPLPAGTGRSSPHIRISPTLNSDRPLSLDPVSPEVQAVITRDIMDTDKPLHPIVQRWVNEHSEEQAERLANIRKHKNDLFYLGLYSELPDLTERDWYRFHASSSLFQGLALAGVKIENAAVSGRLTVLVDGHSIKCTFVEKMRQGRPKSDTPPWTAYPEHHNAGLHSTGFLRFTIDTYLGTKKPEWVETPGATIASLLPDIIASILAAGQRLGEREAQDLEMARIQAEAEMVQQERARLAEQERQRTERLRKCSADWHEARTLRQFIDEMERRADPTAMIEGRTVAEWLVWAREKADILDPFSGISSVAISQILRP